jgi:hypothetical protein
MNRYEICTKIIQSVKDYINTPENLEAHRAPKHFVRKRMISISQVIMYLFYSSKASMYQNLAGIREELSNLKFPDISKQALSKARQFISPNLFKELYYLSVDLFYKNVGERRLWHGYHLYAIDGSKIELPNSKSNFEFFGEMFGCPDPSRRFTMGLASIVYDVLDDYIVHASLHRFLASERSAAIGHLKQLEDIGIHKDGVVIFDRGYYSESLFRYCVSHGHLCVMRLKEGLKISKSCKGDTVSTLRGNPDEGTGDTEIRVIEVTLDDGSKEYLATNIFNTEITAEMFRELYFYRWPVESKYKELKNGFSIEEFNGATTTSIFQEFYLNLLLSNISSLLKNSVDEEIRISSKDTNKHRYQANRYFIIGRVKKVIPKVLCGICGLASIDDIYQDALRCRSQILPGRSFKRKGLKSKGRSHYRNKKTAL